MKKVLLIDANSIIHRSFHALPPFTTPEGKPSGAIYGIASILLKLWRDERPDYAAVLFDRPEPTFRDEKYDEYKAQRPPTADELISQLIEAPNLFHAFGIQTFEKARYEADDLIAAYAKGNGDQATAVGKVNDLISRAPKIPDQFVAGTSSTDFPGVSRAKPELWQNMDKVKALAAALLANEQKLLAAVKSGDRQATMDQLVVTFRNGCGACHTDYRAPKT